MEELWQLHTSYEFELKDADLAVSTMVPHARVMHLPSMSGASGRDRLRAYYADVFIPSQPPDSTLDVVARSIGPDVLSTNASWASPTTARYRICCPGWRQPG